MFDFPREAFFRLSSRSFPHYSEPFVDYHKLLDCTVMQQLDQGYFDVAGADVSEQTIDDGEELLRVQKRLKTVLKQIKAIENQILNHTQRQAPNQQEQDRSELDRMQKRNRTLFRWKDVLRCKEIHVLKSIESEKQSAGGDT
jgi:hypothetical protein